MIIAPILMAILIISASSAQAQITVETLYPTYTSATSVILHGHVYEIEDMDDGDTLQIYFELNEPGGPVATSQVFLVTNKTEDEHFVAPMYGLDGDTDYEYRIFAGAIDGDPILVVGDIETFETEELDFDAPTVGTNYATAESSNSATLSGTVEEFGGYNESTNYFKIGTDPTNLNIVSPSIITKDPFGFFEIDQNKDLQPEKVTYFQACGFNLSGESCGDVEFFNTHGKSPVDIIINDLEQIGTCSYKIDYDVQMGGGLPLSATATLRVGNPDGEEAFYTREFLYEGDDDEIIIDYSMFVLAGIDIDDEKSLFSLRVTSAGITGRVSGIILFDGETCEDEFGFMMRTTDTDDIDIFPNPATDKIAIKNKEKGEIKIFDVAGQMIQSYEIESGLTEVYISHLPAGVYMIEYQNDHSRSVKKIVKQ